MIDVFKTFYISYALMKLTEIGKVNFIILLMQWLLLSQIFRMNSLDMPLKI